MDIDIVDRLRGWVPQHGPLSDQKLDALEAATEITQLRAQVEVMRDALEAVIRWEMPITGKFHKSGDPMSYGHCYGSNGERDYIRDLATQALAKVKEVGRE